MKLGTKINLVLILVTVITLTIGFWIIIGREAVNIRKQVLADVDAVTQLVHQDIERMYAQIYEQKQSLQGIVDSVVKRNPRILYVEIVDTNGSIIVTTRSVSISQNKERKLELFKKVIKTKELVLDQKDEGAYYELEYHLPIFDSKKNIISVAEIEIKTLSKSQQHIDEARKLLDTASVSVEERARSVNLMIKDGEQYVRNIVNDVSQFGKIDKTAEFGFFHDVVVFDTNLNVIVVTGNDTEEFAHDDLEYVKARRDVATGAKNKVEYSREHEGQSIITRVEPIVIYDVEKKIYEEGLWANDSNQIVGVIETHTLKSAYEDRVNELRVRMLGVGIIFTAVLVIVLAIILEREVVGPIRRYSIVARKVADGDLSQKVEHTSDDEIGQFGTVFNSMVANLRELDRLKSDFISVAAHQLRTPLSGVKWVLKLLLDGDLGAVNNDQKGMLKRGYETNEKMIQLVNDLLNVSRIENGKFGYRFEKNDFMKLIRTLVENAELPSKERNIDVRLENHAGDILEFLFDPEKLLIALQNLVDNAIKYTLPGGRVTIVIKPQGDYVQVKVSDTGVGIPNADVPKLFSKFFRAANVIHLQTDGSGLGLFIVKNIILRHGGQIWVDSTEGKGTVFTVVIPVIAELLPKEAETDGAPEGKEQISDVAKIV
ncbi:MAG: HAMP domain-containing histidine kinase [Candidatus Pacebacteria bacterium]|nr:HAMP domain-containing histidine kinase [Candidatus Paceibacterota bacterium]